MISFTNRPNIPSIHLKSISFSLEANSSISPTYREWLYLTNKVLTGICLFWYFYSTFYFLTCFPFTSEFFWIRTDSWGSHWVGRSRQTKTSWGEKWGWQTWKTFLILWWGDYCRKGDAFKFFCKSLGSCLKIVTTMKQLYIQQREEPPIVGKDA